MKHLALICPELSGHLNPMTTLGAELAGRGHTVTLVGKPDGRARTEAAGLRFRPIGADEFPEGAVATISAELGMRHGLGALRFTIRHFHESARVILRDLPEVVRREKIDGLLVDQTSAAAGSVADAAGIPFVTVANALAINPDPLVPPVVTTWPARETWTARTRNRLAYWALTRLLRPIDRMVNAYRAQHGLGPIHGLEPRFSRLAQIAQQPAAFDFPRARRCETFHYAGPFHRVGADRDAIEFPWDRLDGRPLIYASMGTLQNRLGRVFAAIAEACAALDAQLVMSLGGATAELPRELPGDPLVVRFAPQLRLLEKATLTITHGGLNTALESLACGVPMVAIPITNDQPGVAARLAWTGAGTFLTLDRLNPARLRRAVEGVLANGCYRREAHRLRDEIAAADGIRVAADIIDRVME